MPTATAEITLADVQYARIVYACLDRDYTGSAPPMRVKITKEAAKRLIRSSPEGFVYRWDDGDDLTIIPCALWATPAPSDPTGHCTGGRTGGPVGPGREALLKSPQGGSMSLYVEVHCDVMKEGHDPDYILLARCWSHRGDNPQGGSQSSAYAAARRSGWLISTRRAICPGCQDPRPIARVRDSFTQPPSTGDAG